MATLIVVALCYLTVLLPEVGIPVCVVVTFGFALYDIHDRRKM